MARDKGGRVTLAQVSEAAGVSLSTVSKVLNGRADVAESTRRTVERAMEDLGYTARTEPKNPNRRKSLLVVMGGGINAYAAEVLNGAMEAAREMDLSLTISKAPSPEDIDPAEVLREVAAEGHIGVVIITPRFTAEQIAYLARRRLPMAMIDPFDPVHDEGVSVGTTNWAGGMTATEYLLDQGHRRIGFVGGPMVSMQARARGDGYRAALDRAGVPFDEDRAVFGDFAFEAGQELGRHLLELNDPPTAIFAASDPSALGVMAAARERGVAIPDDLSVIGFDDTVPARWAVPPLTTIRQPMPEMGRSAVRLVAEQARGETPACRRLELATELVVRGTVGPPRSASAAKPGRPAS
jgi:LacI family transcriptional regulator